MIRLTNRFWKQFPDSPCSLIGTFHFTKFELWILGGNQWGELQIAPKPVLRLHPVTHNVDVEELRLT
jgi:hypothetical protein